ncbi:MAG: hypothetical protein Q8S00_02310, partial [Deltaproteobacteria bacterium]|nr:hypothetical protein [Deltaproteobacteria bacterium]
GDRRRLIPSEGQFLRFQSFCSPRTFGENSLSPVTLRALACCHASVVEVVTVRDGLCNFLFL